MNTWCVFYHSIQGKFHWTPSWTRIRKKTPFSSKIVLVLLRFAILPLQQCCWPRPAGILPVIPFCKRSATQKEIRQTKNKKALHQFDVLPPAIHCCCEHLSLFLQIQSFHLQSHQKLHIFRKYNFLAGRIFQNFWIGAPCSIGRSFWLF